MNPTPTTVRRRVTMPVGGNGVRKPAVQVSYPATTTMKAKPTVVEEEPAGEFDEPGEPGESDVVELLPATATTTVAQAVVADSVAPPTDSGDETYEALRADLVAGMNAVDAAAKHNISAVTVRRKADAWGIALRKGRPTGVTKLVRVPAKVIAEAVQATSEVADETTPAVVQAAAATPTTRRSEPSEGDLLILGRMTLVAAREGVPLAALLETARRAWEILNR